LRAGGQAGDRVAIEPGVPCRMCRQVMVSPVHCSTVFFLQLKGVSREKIGNEADVKRKGQEEKDASVVVMKE